jgi:hypothetical protein
VARTPGSSKLKPLGAEMLKTMQHCLKNRSCVPDPQPKFPNREGCTFRRTAFLLYVFRRRCETAWYGA